MTASLLSIVLRHKRIATVIGVIIVAAISTPFLLHVRLSDTAAAEAPQHTVDLIDTAGYVVSGAKTTSATQEFVVRSEVSGRIASIATEGQRVNAGDVIAQLDNASQRAALLQAEGTLGVAQAGESKTKSGLRSEQLAIRSTSLENAKNNAVAALLNAYAAVDSAMYTNADQRFSPITNSTAPKFAIELKDMSTKFAIEQQRLDLQRILDRESGLADSLNTSSNLADELSATTDDLRTTLDFVQLIITGTAGAIPTNSVSASEISSYRTSMSTARSGLSSALSGVTSAAAALSTAEASLKEGESYVQTSDIDSATSLVKQAQGGYEAALAAYNKTVIRARSAGRVLGCSVTTGDIVNAGNDICRVSSTADGIGGAYALPLSAVKYTPAGASVFVVNGDGTLKSIPVESGLVSASSVTVTGPLAGERIVKDVRGLREGESVAINP